MSADLSAQDTSSVIPSRNVWIVYNGTYRLHKFLGLQTIYHWRRREGLRYWMQSAAYLAADLHFHPQGTFSLGTAWIRTFPSPTSPTLRDEMRLWTQIAVTHKLNSLQILHRYRFDYRFFATRRAQRVRYFLNLSHPIYKSFHAVVNNELFLHLGQAARPQPLDQNRFYIGLMWKSHASTSLQIGYMNQYIIQPNRHLRYHTFHASLIYNFSPSTP
ncbi:MAG: DUF2490 domain-containing protein [Bacteroidia bacterium]